MELDYEYYNKQSNEHDTSVEEDDIYETPCDVDNDDYGPIYTQPPTEVDEIYETLKGRNFLKLFHKDIKWVYFLCIFVIHIISVGLLGILVLENLELLLMVY